MRFDILVSINRVTNLPFQDQSWSFNIDILNLDEYENELSQQIADIENELSIFSDVLDDESKEESQSNQGEFRNDEVLDSDVEFIKQESKAIDSKRNRECDNKINKIDVSQVKPNCESDEQNENDKTNSTQTPEEHNFSQKLALKRKVTLRKKTQVKKRKAPKSKPEADKQTEDDESEKPKFTRWGRENDRILFNWITTLQQHALVDLDYILNLKKVSADFHWNKIQLIADLSMWKGTLAKLVKRIQFLANIKTFTARELKHFKKVMREHSSIDEVNFHKVLYDFPGKTLEYITKEGQEFFDQLLQINAVISKNTKKVNSKK